MPHFSPTARLTMTSARRFVWRFPEWWSLALTIAAWVVLFSTPRHVLSHQSTAAALQWWMLMVVAMMLPLVTAQVRHAAFHSLWSRRHRAISWFLAGYLVPWLAFGAFVVVVQGQVVVDRRAATIIAIVIAVAWQFSSSRRRALRRCHQVIPLAPRGWRADSSCLRYGWSVGASCVWACWALMMACAVADHSMWTMGAATLVASLDRTG